MTLETILWILAGLIIWELIYIYFLKSSDLEGSNWLELKFLAFLCTLFFIGFQLLIVTFEPNAAVGVNKFHYINLVWEVLVLGALAIFFYINKMIAKLVTRGGRK